MFWLFGLEACGNLGPWPGIEHTPRALEGGFLTIGPPGKFLFFLIRWSFSSVSQPHFHFVSFLTLLFLCLWIPVMNPLLIWAVNTFETKFSSP